jgi:glycosyltransferase involved in cell wall biosynthesis
MRVLHVTPSFYPALVYGGPTQSVYQLCCALVRNGCEVRVLTTDANGPDAVLDVDTDRDIEIENGLWVRYCHRIFDVSVSPALLRLLAARIRWADVVHLMAVYSFPTIPTLLLCKLLGKPVVWSPRGMLQRWEGTRKPKLKALWEMVCRLIAPKRFILHVTSDQEAAESAGRFSRAQIAVIPNGVEVPPSVSRPPSSVSGPQSPRELRLVYLGRFDPKKGIENLLQARSMLNGDVGSRLSLTIAGAGDVEYEKTLEITISQMAPAERPKMIGSVSGGEKAKLFENADVVVVPSYTENFGLVVAEALAHGVPVIASKGTPWQRVEQVGCGLWVNNSPESLAAAIKQISRMPLREMGQRGREWMQREYSWDLIAKRTMKLYISIVPSHAN